RARLPARPHRREGQTPQGLLRRRLRALRRADLRRRRPAPRGAPLPTLQTAVATALDPRHGPRGAPLLARTLRLHRLLSRLVGHTRATPGRGRARALPLSPLAIAIGHPTALRHTGGRTRRRVPSRSR